MSGSAFEVEDVRRETMEADVLIVGGGAAGLAAALHLQNSIARHNEAVASGSSAGPAIPEQMIVVLEKGAEIGAHSLSGAVMNPVALAELMPDFREQGAPIDCAVERDAVYYLGRDFQLKFPFTPPQFKNEGNLLISLAKLNRWLGQQCEARGINVFPGFAAVEALYEGDRVVGVRTGDKGRDKNGARKANFEPGMILRAKLTIFAEGTRGSLFKKVAERLGLAKGKNPDVYEEGVKEVVQMPPGTVQAGQVIHTMGFPLYKTMGGTFIYTYPNDQIVVGLVGYLDTADPLFDPHRELQKLKTHPFLRKMLEGGRVIAYGGKTLPAGGWYSMPKLFANGMLVAGDSAGMVDVKRLKGIHLSIKAGMLAAETALEAIVAGDFSEARLAAYAAKVDASYIRDELWQSRNAHQALSKGILVGAPLLALQEVTGGRGLCDKMPIEHRDAQATERALEVWGADALANADNQLPKPDGTLFFDKLGSVYLTGTMHDEDSPCHLLVPNRDICREECHPKYNSPCNHFCPASVYEMVADEERPGKKRLQINFTNCIHCKTCDIKCPFENIEWTAPEGGGGPNYKET
jgi:electron-transferring-flavoprotein dehydrogenase